MMQNHILSGTHTIAALARTSSLRNYLSTAGGGGGGGSEGGGAGSTQTFLFC